uniref:uncharacterized protein tasor2 isoform X2 n=1 Tax=Scatophagus argus TaxID=75038 RepID=UPI001ED850DE|nr:uncharacterized protein tasor2 isoform X2 [Scatophagus argus]
MESGNGDASSKGNLVPVSTSCDTFQKNILASLKSAYLYEESKQCFRYKSAVLIKNPVLENKYCAFRAKKREAGYSEDELKESYGFLLFDDVNKANALGETGVLTGNSTCTTLGDPSNGVYISMYSDCLDLNRWYHGKSGYIAIIRLTKGRVKKVLENYTQNFTTPTEGFDCHVSEQLSSVSAKTSSFLAFERTQYYMYELLDDGSNETDRSPSAACPFAIVSFSYTDTKATLVAPQEKSKEKELVCHYIPWRGQLQIGPYYYNVELRTTAGALIPAELPPVVKVEQAISMIDLRQLLPKTVFETGLSGEVFLDGLYCSLCELFLSEAEQTSSFSLVLREIKDKDVALTVLLNDGGFLILLHSCNFLTFDGTGSSATEVLQGIFVFPDSRVIRRDTKLGQRKPGISSEILRVLPILSYAEGEVEKKTTDPCEELCEVLVQHMQNYAALISPGLALSPTRDLSIFPDQYDVPDAHKHLYTSPEWTNRAWQNVRSYLSKPVSFQLPVSKASEILSAGQEERIEDLDDDVYFCLSSPEEASTSHVSNASEDELTREKPAVNVETSMDSCMRSAEAQIDLTDMPQHVVSEDLQPVIKDTEILDQTLLIKTDNMETTNLVTPTTSDDLPTELIVSITSAEQTVNNASVISTESATKQNDFQPSGFSTAKLQTSGVNSLDDETVTTKKAFECPELTNLTQTKRKKLHRGLPKGQKRVSTETQNLQTVKIQMEDDNLKNHTQDRAKESSECSQLSNPSNIDWRKVRRRKRKFGKLSTKNKKVKSATVGLAVAKEKKTNPGQQSFDSTILKELEAFPLRKKMERWDLKPAISECGRILVPYGSVDNVDRIKTLKDDVQSTNKEKMLIDASVNTQNTDEMEQESSIASETAGNKTEATKSKGEGNHPQNIFVDHVNPEDSIERQSDDGSGSLPLNPESNEHSSEYNGKDTPPLKTVQEKHTDTTSPENRATKGEILLNKLKSVLLRGKRKAGILVTEKTTGIVQDTEPRFKKTTDIVQDTEPCFKKGKVDLDPEMLKSNDSITCVQDANLGVKEVSEMISVDPLFALALGLTPKETANKIHKFGDQDSLHGKELSESQEQTIVDKQPEIIQRPLSIFPRRGRIKTLKKHQGISAENVKKKWWLHFQTPACFASEKLKYKECNSDNSVSKTKSSSACPPTDALNLLADLALSASSDQVPPQPDPAQGTSLKECDLRKDAPSAEQESVLHALLRERAAIPIQPLESPSPSHLVGGSELVALISKEHAYSLPPSSSLLLDLSGTPFQVSPLSGSTRLLHHHQTMYSDGIKTLHHTVNQEDRSDHNHRTQEHVKKHMMHRRKFRHSRTFVNKDGSVQVTKQWKENYDFSLDSKFTSDPKYRSIIRALHGPWDFSTRDTNEELQLIVHMWIGLFYSRSTARFFHFDSNCTNPCSEDSDSSGMASGVMTAPAQCELKANSFAPHLNETDTSETLTSKALDLSKKDNPVLDQGSVILDLSLKNTSVEIVPSDPQVKQKETSVSGEQKDAIETLNTLESSVGLQKCSRKSVHTTENISEWTDVRSTNERTCFPFQTAGCLENTDVPYFKGGGTFTSVKEMESVSDQQNHPTASGIGHVLHGCDNEKTDMKNGIENSEATEMCSVQKQEGDSSKSMTDQEVDGPKKADDVVLATEHDESELKDVENWKVKEKPYQEGDMQLSLKIICTGSDSTNKESGIVCNGNLLENEKQLSREEPTAVSAGKAESVTEPVGCCAVHEDKVIENDHSGKEDGLDEKNPAISDMEADSDLNAQPLPVMHDGSDSVKKDCFTDCNRQIQLEEQQPQADNKDDACYDLQLRNGSVLIDEYSISEKAPHTLSDKEPTDDEPAVQESSESDICLAKLHDQSLPVCDRPDSVTNCITECNAQAPLNKKPPQGDEQEDACHDWQTLNCKSKLCANGFALTNEHAISEDAPQAPLERGPIYSEPVVEENSEKYICLVQVAHSQKVASPISDESSCLLHGSSAEVSIPPANDSVGTESQNKVMLKLNPNSDDHEHRDTKSVEGEQNVDNITQQSHLPQWERITKCKTEVALRKETDLNSDKTNEGLEKAHSRVVIPFIGIDISGEDTIEPEEAEDQKELSFVSEATCPKPALCSSSGMYNIKAELPASKMSPSLLNVRETNEPEVLQHESNSRCPTPTMDEEPYQYITCYGPNSSSSNSSSSFFSGSETCKNVALNCLSRSSTLMKDKMPLEQKLKSTVNSNPNPHALPPNLEQRSLGVQHSIDKLLSKSNPTNGFSHLKTTDMKHPLDQTNKLQGTSIGQERFHPYRFFSSTECSQAFKLNIDQDGHKTALQTNLCHEPRTYTQRPVMAVKPSKSDEIHADCSAKNREIENFVMSKFSRNNPTKTSLLTCTAPASMIFEKKTESPKGNSAALHDDKQEASDSRNPSSSFPVQSFQSQKSSSSLADGNQSFVTNSLIEKVGQTTKESFEIDQKDSSDASTSAACYKDDSLFQGPQSSLTCTVFNRSQKRSESFLEQISKRCLQDDLTEALMEQECLIFSEQMKQLLKRSKKGPIHHTDAQHKLNLSGSNPMIVRFSLLEEQEDSLEPFDAPSLVGQKIKVDMSDRKDLADTTEEENTLFPQKISEGKGNPVEHAGISGVTAECARQYTAMMDDVCAVRKFPSKLKNFRMDRGYTKTEPCNHFDFCDQMKREVDESFRSNLNSVVKKSCKMKYRFYILVTSDDAFFEETKAQLEAEGHTAVQPSEFFLGEDSSSSLLIVLRNEDIAEHICEVPHLLKLKKSPGVQFAGIDEPDDVVNLTHQELFIRGGFFMFDRVVLESLSLCNLKKMAEILQDLSRTGKWKWMLHYRDSRRLKENARLSTEAKEKKHLLNWCQEVGILEILPYHECDFMSRDQPDYLTCLVRLQVQNISTRYPVFITDTATTGSSFEANGILTMTFGSILTCSPSEIFTV